MSINIYFFNYLMFYYFLLFLFSFLKHPKKKRIRTIIPLSIPLSIPLFLARPTLGLDLRSNLPKKFKNGPTPNALYYIKKMVLKL